MTHDKLVQEIKSLGYWRIEIHSTTYKENRLPSKAAMDDILKQATVSLGGWSYPYFFGTERTTYNGKWLEGQVNWEDYREYWRLYESGQWLHYMGLPAARITRERRFAGRSPLPPQHAGYLHVRGDVLFPLTIILRFTIGLAQSGILEPAASISIQLHNTQDYMLFESFERFFPHQYVNSSDRPIEYKHIFPVSELSASANQVALEMSIKIFEVFGWTPSEAALRNLSEDQIKLIERRL